MSLRTEHTYIDWFKDFTRFHRLKHPATLGGDDRFLQQPLGDLDFTFATKPRRLPEVLSTPEVAAI